MTTSPGPISTPPGTTLSTPSPTELHDTDPLADSMPPTQLSRAMKHIYLVVATTPVTTASGSRLGIGLNGGLPWPLIKSDMAYFRKVTTDGRVDLPKVPNLVIMGRKTYESIPIGFRPLSQRHNFVVTRSNLLETAQRYREDILQQSKRAHQSVQERYANSEKPSLTELNPKSVEFREMFLGEAQFTITTESDSVRINASNGAIMPLSITSTVSQAVQDASDQSHGAIFCIGGAEIYNIFLQDPSLRPRLRILQTEIRKLTDGQEFNCDTYWPEDLHEPSNGWVEADPQEVVEWTGIGLPQGEAEWDINKTVDVKIRVKGWKQKEQIH